MGRLGIDYKKLYFWTIFCFVSAAFCFIFFAFPVCNDDWWALAEIRDGGVLGSLKIRFYHDTIRLGNVVAICSIIWPKWLTCSLISASFVFGFWLMARLSGLSSTKWRGMALLAFLVWVFPLWEDAMFSHMYAFNYIPAIALFFGGIYIFMHPTKCPVWLSVIVGVLLGAWHESYSILFITGAILCFISDRSLFEKRRIILAM